MLSIHAWLPFLMFLRVMLIVYVDFNLSIYTWQVQIKNNVLVPMCDIILVWSLHKVIESVLTRAIVTRLVPIVTPYA